MSDVCFLCIQFFHFDILVGDILLWYHNISMNFFNNLGITQRGTAMSCLVCVNGVTFAGQGMGDWTGSGTMARQISVFKKQPKKIKRAFTVDRWFRLHNYIPYNALLESIHSKRHVWRGSNKGPTSWKNADNTASCIDWVTHFRLSNSFDKFPTCQACCFKKVFTTNVKS